jgi:hypothetical protein
LDVPNKSYELLEQICICVEKILQAIRIKYVYVPHKLYELTEQIIELEQIFTRENKYLKQNNKYVKKNESWSIESIKRETSPSEN